MFSKLLKHEWRSSRLVLGILSIAAASAGVLLIVLAFLWNALDDQLAGLPDDAYVALETVVILGIIFTVFLLLAYLLATQILLYVQFYREKFTDRGYLTFTLPVKTEQIYWSSILNIFFWSAISITLMFTVIVPFVLILEVDPSDAVDYVTEPTYSESSSLSMLYGLASLFKFAANAVYFLVTPLACITIGSTVCKRAKLFAAFGLYYGVTYTVNIINLMITYIPDAILLEKGWSVYTEHLDTLRIFTNLGTGLLYLLLAVGGYFLTIRLMKRKLNLS